MRGESKGQLHVISTGKQSMEEFVEISKHISPFVDLFHLREKRWTSKQIIVAVEKLEKEGIPLEKIHINDRADIALMKNAGGVQLGHQSAHIHLVKNAFPSLRLGSSVHSEGEAVEAFTGGTDFLLCGNVYATSSKPGKAGIGLARFKRVVQSVPVPTIAIGGITPERVAEVMQTGARGIAVLSGIFLAGDPVKAASSYDKELRKEVNWYGKDI
ncbi:thiamine phosphate synthase (plasmid) [Cytobacillus spongiae]|uniref:thiamine phosphate synthase n=1 Tax=Cytobacillus spongiae TaxID=2901381 RepID=UPI001F27442E|nr:thiamine phosphate synthase [Cytobacillus spongiae]UII58432.1 thiamine phosphate synthase [Cytobacillus spongiae]